MHSGLTLQGIKNIDKSDMLAELLDFPQHCIAAKQVVEESQILFSKRNFKNVFFSGMGGSSIGMGLVRDYLYFESKIPIFVSTQHNIPAWIDKDTLVVISSYSGMTQEMLSVYKQVINRQANIVIISSGGRLKDLAQKQKLSFIPIQKGLLPRYALGYLSMIPLFLLCRLGIVEDKTIQVKEAVSVLEDLRDRVLRPQVAMKDNLAKSIAHRIKNKFVAVYTAAMPFEVVALRLRCQLNENAKILATSHFFPEVNHNEIEGWQGLPKGFIKNCIAIILKDRYLEEYIKRGMELAEEFLRKDGTQVINVYSRGEELLSRILSLIYIGDFISFYLSILYGKDPAETLRIDYFKKELTGYYR